MYLTALQVQSMDENELRLFLDRGLQEGRHLDYKRSYDKPTAYEGKKEFLKDVTGMANAGGGTIIIGVEERDEGDGLPGSIVGIEDGENLSQQWENLTKSCIDPRIPGFITKPIPLPDGKNVVIVHIPNSMRKPHMVMIEKHRGFYIRHNRDTVPMSVDEIRTAVLVAEGAPDKAQAYLLARELDIRQTKMFNPCPLLLQVIPLVPLEAEIDPLSLEIEKLLRDSQKLKIDDVHLSTSIQPLPTLWGVEAGSSRDNPRYLMEIHRNGYIQALIFTTQKRPHESAQGDRWLHMGYRSIIKAFLRLCELITEEQQIASPYLVRIKWIGARGGYFWKAEAYFQEQYGPWSLEDLTLPEVIHQPGDPWEPLADRLFTYLCNAFGTKDQGQGQG